MAKRQTIQQYLGLPKTWPVKEKIKHAIVLTPNKADIRNADRKDPQACALHNTACRVFNVPNAAIGGRKVGGKGKPRGKLKYHQKALRSLSPALRDAAA